MNLEFRIRINKVQIKQKHTLVPSLFLKNHKMSLFSNLLRFLKRVGINLLIISLIVGVANVLPIPRWRTGVIFMSVAGLVLAQWHLYVKVRIVDPWLKEERRLGRLVKWTHLSYAVLSCAAPVLAKFFMGALVSAALICFLSNMWLLCLITLLNGVHALISTACGKRTPWTAKQESAFIVFSVLAFTAAAYYEASLEYQVNRVDVQLPGLSRELTITHLSDLHLGSVLGLDFCHRVLATVKRLDSDLVVITGDLFDISYHHLPESIPGCVALMGRVFYVTGNHEYFTSTVEEWLDALSSSGVVVLQNDCACVDGLIDVVGINDLTAHRYSDSHAADVAKAVASCPSSSPPLPRLFLAHQPNHVAAIAAYSANSPTLVLSGHTHGGQVFPATLLVHLANLYVEGHARHDDDVQVIVSRGTGQWGPKLRLGSRAEIIQIVVHPQI